VLLSDGSFRLKEDEPSVIAICHNFHQLPAAKRWSGLVVSFAGQMGTTLAADLLVERYPNLGSRDTR